MDQPGPHPENQRKRRELRGPRRGLIGVLAIAGALAIITGARLLAGRPIDLVATSPHTTGILLAVVIGGTQVLAALLLLIHHIRARMVALVAALLAVAWSVLQIMLIDGVTWFQLALLGVGALEAAFVAGCTPRDDGSKKQMRGRP